MPISYRIDGARGVVHIRLEGEVTVPEIQEYRARLRADPSYRTGLHRLIDARGIERDFSRAEIRRLADVMRVDEDLGRPTRRAVLLERTDHIAAMDLVQAYTRGSPAEYRVFRSRAEAERWLDLVQEKQHAGDDDRARFVRREPPPAGATLTPEETMPQEHRQPQSANDQDQRSGGYGDDTGMAEPRPGAAHQRAAETHGDSAVGREDPSTGTADADEALGNRVGGYGRGPEDGRGTGLPDAD